MDFSKIRKGNVINYYAGYFLTTISTILLVYFFPFYLKEEGFTILQIGTFATIGIAMGTSLGSSIIGKIISKIKLKTGLMFSSILGIMEIVSVFFLSSVSGLAFQKGINSIRRPVNKISGEVTLQHNTSQKNHRKTMAVLLALEAIATVLGLAVSVILIDSIGFKKALIIFIAISILPLIFFNKINDKHRIPLKKKYFNLKVSQRLRALMVAEVLYWLALSSSLVIVITFLVSDYFGGGKGWLAIIFASLYLPMIFSSFISEKYLGKKNLYKTSMVGMSLQMLGAVIVVISTNLYILILALVIEGIGAGIWVPSKTALYWKHTKTELREKASAYLIGRRSAASAIGPLLGGLLVTYFGILSPFYFKIAICFISLGIYATLMKTVKNYFRL